MKEWTYYLLDGAKRQLAVYEGIESSQTSCGLTLGNLAYLSASEYLYYGGGSTHNFTIKPINATSSRKEYKVQDMLGSTRVAIEPNGSGGGVITGQYDYAPFGKVMWKNGLEKRLSYIDKEKDAESGDHNFGVRQYDDVSGRFMAIDPLWEKYRGLSPYVYSFNNPLSIIDPTGKSGEAVIDHDAATIEISSHFIFYGGAANEGIAKKLTDKISEKWNGGNWTVKVDDKPYTVKFNITYEVKSRTDVLSDISKNGDNALNNYIRLEKDFSGPSSMKGNSGSWKETDYLMSDGSVDYTPAHEYMHGFGIAKHTAWDEKSGGVPDIGYVYPDRRQTNLPVVTQNIINMIFQYNQFKPQSSGKQKINMGSVNNEMY